LKPFPITVLWSGLVRFLVTKAAGAGWRLSFVLKRSQHSFLLPHERRLIATAVLIKNGKKLATGR
jgi:hypothetical protein